MLLRQTSQLETGSSQCCCSAVHSWQGILWYGMVWNGIWNGRKKSVWNMEWLKYAMEDFMYRMEQIFHIPYKFHTCTFWHGVAEVRFFFQLNILANSLSSTRTVIRKLRASFVISVTNSNIDAKRRSLILILFSWGQGTLSPDFCMFTSVLPACHYARRDRYLASIASNVAL